MNGLPIGMAVTFSSARPARIICFRAKSAWTIDAVVAEPLSSSISPRHCRWAETWRRVRHDSLIRRGGRLCQLMNRGLPVADTLD